MMERGNRDSNAEAPMISSSEWAARITNRGELLDGTVRIWRDNSCHSVRESACRFMQSRLTGEHAYRLAIAVERADVNVSLAAFHANCISTIREISIDQGADVLVRPPTL